MRRPRRLLPIIVAAICAALTYPAAAQAVYKPFQTPSGQIMCAYFDPFEAAPQIRCDLLFLNDRAAVITRSGKGRIVKVTDAVGNRGPASWPTAPRCASASTPARRGAAASPAANRSTRHGFTVSRQSRRVF